LITLIAGALAVFFLILFYFDVRNPLANILSYGFSIAFLAAAVSWWLLIFPGPPAMILKAGSIV
jgi:hypothetical protein